MKKLIIVLPLILILAGCSTYKFQRGKAPYDQGYVVARDKRPILEYTVGKDNSVPDIDIAKERFKRRRAQVEYYYKKMGYMENRFKQTFLDPPGLIFKFFIGLFRMPFIVTSDYRYNHNPKYKEKIDKLDENEYLAEKARIKDLRSKLDAYIKEDLIKEYPELAKQAEQPVAVKEEVKLPQEQAVSLKPEEQPVVATQVISPAQESAPIPKTEELPEVKQEISTVKVIKEPIPIATLPKPEPLIEEKPAEIVQIVEPTIKEEALEVIKPIAVIAAKPIKGFSPLKVNFSAGKSYASKSRIVSYSWDFGDGEKSTKKNATNTYWSVTYGSRIFTATLTVTDNKGVSGTSSIDIEVVTK